VDSWFLSGLELYHSMPFLQLEFVLKKSVVVKLEIRAK
jgi:hypothetical protein